MKRSNCSIKFKAGIVAKFSKRYKEQYKKDNGTKYEGNVLYDISVGVIEKKKIPEIEDVLTLIKLGQMDCTDEAAEAVLDKALESDEYKDRGLLGIHCDLCKDICLDIPVHAKFTEVVMNLEDTTVEMLEARNKIKELTSQLSGLLKNVENNMTAIEDSKENEVAETVE
jgi:hypothetical protein